MITKENIVKLREETGCSKTDCSKALDIAHYDYDKAIQWLKDHTGGQRMIFKPLVEDVDSNK